MEQVGIRVYANEEEKNGMLGVASLSLGGQMAISGIRIANGKYGPYLQMPSMVIGEGPEGKHYQDVFYPADSLVRKELTRSVMKVYEQAVKNENHMAEAPAEKTDLPYDVRVSLSEYSGSEKANVTLRFQNVFYVENVKVRLKPEEDRYYVTMPSYKTKTGEWKSYAYPVTAEFRNQLNEGILQAFQEIKKSQEQNI